MKKPLSTTDQSIIFAYAAVLRSFHRTYDQCHTYRGRRCYYWGWQAAVWPTHGWKASFWIKSVSTFRTQREAQQDCQKQLDLLGLGKAKAPP